MKKQRVDLGEYKIDIEYNDDGSGHLIVTVLDEAEGPIEGIEISNSDEEDEE
jgi:hypothetical protein